MCVCVSKCVCPSVCVPSVCVCVSKRVCVRVPSVCVYVQVRCSSSSSGGLRQWRDNLLTHSALLLQVHNQDQSRSSILEAKCSLWRGVCGCGCVCVAGRCV